MKRNMQCSGEQKGNQQRVGNEGEGGGGERERESPLWDKVDEATEDCISTGGPLMSTSSTDFVAEVGFWPTRKYETRVSLQR
jgi:hypothetical protein